MTKGVDPFRILALTFTNKAAKEMKERIAKLLAECPELSTEARNLWMGTFHSMFARILRAEADKMGYPKDFTIYDTDDSRSVIKGIVKEWQAGRQVVQAQSGTRSHQYREEQPDRSAWNTWPIPS
jgi:DNA helicase-2/ATP-dependent DNA helicase PcrA